MAGETCIPAKQLENKGTFTYLQRRLLENEAGWCSDDNVLYIKNGDGKLVPLSKIVVVDLNITYEELWGIVFGDANGHAGGAIPVLTQSQGEGSIYLYPEWLGPGDFRFGGIWEGKYYWAICKHLEGTWERGSKDLGDHVQSDWSESDSSKPDFIKNKPNLAPVATSGSYDDLSDTPDLDTKVDKVAAQEGKPFVYGRMNIEAGGAEGKFTMDATAASSNTVVQRNGRGQICTAQPTDSNHATPKKYVDDADATASTKVKQEPTSVNQELAVILKGNNLAETATAQEYFNISIHANPSTGNLSAATFTEGGVKLSEKYQAKLPGVENDRYLHTNKDTGALEWSEVQGGGSTYTAGNGINIENATIECKVDDTLQFDTDGTMGVDAWELVAGDHISIEADETNKTYTIKAIGEKAEKLYASQDEDDPYVEHSSNGWDQYTSEGNIEGAEVDSLIATDIYPKGGQNATVKIHTTNGNLQNGGGKPFITSEKTDESGKIQVLGVCVMDSMASYTALANKDSNTLYFIQDTSSYHFDSEE